VKITIEDVNNGWILRSSDNTPEDEKVSFVFEQEIDNEESYYGSAQRMMYQVMDSLGIISDRHSKHRLYICIQPGDKHPDYCEEFDKFWR
jgi:hypothetical protein